jgi:hypothetical protein
MAETDTATGHDGSDPVARLESTPQEVAYDAAPELLE